MKPEFLEYLKSIGITNDIYLSRIETIMKVHSELVQEEISDIYVDDYFKEDGTREYADISFFSQGFSFGAYNFLTEDNFSISIRIKKITHIYIKKKNYDFKKATASSRLTIDIFYEMTSANGTFKASQENCDALTRIFFKYIKPNVMI